MTYDIILRLGLDTWHVWLQLYEMYSECIEVTSHIILEENPIEASEISVYKHSPLVSKTDFESVGQVFSQV